MSPPREGDMFKMLLPDDPRLVYRKEEEHSSPPEGIIEHIKDHFWLVHPERGLVFWKFSPTSSHQKPLCNKTREIAETNLRFCPWAELRQVPSFFWKINPRDYA